MARAACLALFCLSPLPVAAQDFCTDLKALTQEVQTGPEMDATAPFVRDASACAFASDETGARQYYCYWVFAYRAPAAKRAFEALKNDTESCFDDVARLPDDTLVNHPDSYLLHRFRTGGVVVSTALKDKAALQQSLLFLRIEPLRED